MTQATDEQCWVCLKNHEPGECPTVRAHAEVDRLRAEHYAIYLTSEEMWEAWDDAIILEAGLIRVTEAATAKVVAYYEKLKAREPDA
jgi:hypothetical protein